MSFTNEISYSPQTLHYLLLIEPNHRTGFYCRCGSLYQPKPLLAYQHGSNNPPPTIEEPLSTFYQI